MTNYIKAIREAKGMTQAELAKLMETTAQSIGRYERQSQRLNIPLLKEIAGILRCSVSEIIGEETAPADLAKIKSYKEGKQPLYINREFINGLNDEGLIYADIHSDSMAPTINDMDTVIICKDEQDTKGDAVFAFQSKSGLLFLARCSFNPISETSNLKTDNTLSEDYGEITTDLKVVGRVVQVIKNL